MQYVYLNGEFVESNKASVSVFDHGVLYGDGVFEGIRAYGGRVFRLGEHIDRIFAAAKAIALEIPMTKAELSQVVVDSCKKNNLTDCYITGRHARQRKPRHFAAQLRKTDGILHRCGDQTLHRRAVRKGHERYYVRSAA